ncbi:hypothetical protein BAU07_26475 (plasmid) [Bordetella flabilis]|uniref:Uncharacterized protein n=2 Tax=Bordetella flabilis TaxID=463014 RepID=A0A193GLX6_9BORD|nr:hypothetical protein BAU07_26475 [Bordetella flabilis]
MVNGEGIPRGAHIGTYLLDEVVRWAKQWPTAQVRQISLSTVDGSDENRERRNRLYEQFGIVFEYTPDRRSGVSLSTMVAAQLTPVAPEVWGENIEEWGLVEYLRHGCAQIKDLSYSNNRLERVRRDLVAEIEAARARPLRWACRQLWMRYQFNILVIFFVTCVGVMMWAKLSQ